MKLTNFLIVAILFAGFLGAAYVFKVRSSEEADKDRQVEIQKLSLEGEKLKLDQEKLQHDSIENEKDRALQREIMEFKKNKNPN